MEQISFRFFSKRFLGILLILFLCTFGVVWGLKEYQLLLSHKQITLTLPTNTHRQNTAHSVLPKKMPPSIAADMQLLPEQIEQDDNDTYTLATPVSGKELLLYLNEGDCTAIYEKLRVTANTPELHQLVKRLIPFCGEKQQPVLKELEKTFLRAQRNALILYYKKTETGWHRKSKILMTYLIQIRKENPTGQDIPTLLNRAHNFIRQGDLPSALHIIDTLPIMLQPSFSTFNLQAENYLSVVHLLEEYTAL